VAGWAALVSTPSLMPSVYSIQKKHRQLYNPKL